jgi:transcriptional regulator GlxA family with amidase domain
MTYTVGIYIFNQVEVLDFAGPFEVFNTASRVMRRKDSTAEPVFDMVTITETGQAIASRGGLVIQPSFGFGDHPAVDVLVIPGGVVDEEMDNPVLMDWLIKNHMRTTITSSVCTGAFLLAQAGVLNDQRVTTHWEDIADLRNRFPGLQVLENATWVDTGRIVTSAGISAGIGMSLHLVERLYGRELAILTAHQMEFNWKAEEEGK